MSSENRAFERCRTAGGWGGGGGGVLNYQINGSFLGPILSGLEIISRESPDTMTGPIHFSSVTYRFWPVKLYKINNSSKRGP